MSKVGIVIIGRNEGARLETCLRSVCFLGHPVVYVDSGSTDSSLQVAGQHGAEVVELAPPFSAAKARNAGWRRLVELHPEVTLVQFADGDCEVVPDWIATATAALAGGSDVAAVCGRRRERYPDASVYNRLCDVEWDTPVGEAQSCGGDAMMRVAALEQAGGFDDSVVAGEEPELCQRLRQHGWRIQRLDAEMTLHDAAMVRWRQWWRRQVRSGYGMMDVSCRKQVKEFGWMLRSARMWTVGWVAAMAATFVAVFLVGGLAWGSMGAGLLALAVPAQMARVAFRLQRRGQPATFALAYGILTIVGKWPQLGGQLQWLLARPAGKAVVLIEYKHEAQPRRAGTPTP